MWYERVRQEWVGERRQGGRTAVRGDEWCQRMVVRRVSLGPLGVKEDASVV